MGRRGQRRREPQLPWMQRARRRWAQCEGIGSALRTAVIARLLVEVERQGIGGRLGEPSTVDSDLDTG